jgi:hypothetical protein
LNTSARGNKDNQPATQKNKLIPKSSKPLNPEKNVVHEGFPTTTQREKNKTRDKQLVKATKQLQSS